MTVDLLIEDRRWNALQLDVLANAAVSATLKDLNLKPANCEISLLACNDTRIAALNADFRGKPKATNVLSWPSEERGADVAGQMPQMPATKQAIELGDIAIAYDTCAAEAEAATKPMSAHVTHLIVHGTLHLLGFDHERDADATLMEGLETQILGKLGVANPYSVDGPDTGHVKGKE